MIYIVKEDTLLKTTEYRDFLKHTEKAILEIIYHMTIRVNSTMDKYSVTLAVSFFFNKVSTKKCRGSRSTPPSPRTVETSKDLLASNMQAVIDARCHGGEGDRAIYRGAPSQSNDSPGQVQEQTVSDESVVSR